MRRLPKLRLCVTASVLILSSACASVLTVTQVSKTKTKDGKDNYVSQSLPGVPFYQKRGTCRQETAYVEPIVIIKKSKNAEDGTGKVISTESETKAFRFRQGEMQLLKLRKCLADPGQCGSYNSAQRTIPKTFEDVWNDLPDSLPVPQSPDDLIKNMQDIILASNKVAATAYVDYETVTYLNGNLPWLGSNEVSIETNEDGSLSKASAKAESKVGDLIPIKEGLSAIFHLGGGAAKSGSAGGGQEAENAAPQVISTSFTLDVSVQFFQYTFARNNEPGSRCVLLPPITLADYFNPGGIEFSWSQLSLGDDRSSSDKSGNDKAGSDSSKKSAKKKPANGGDGSDE